MTTARKQKEALEHAWEEAQNRLKSAQDACTKAALSLEHAEYTEKETKEKRDKAYAQFSRSISKSIL